MKTMPNGIKAINFKIGLVEFNNCILLKYLKTLSDDNSIAYLDELLKY